jgi:acetyltransferase EpsM
MTCYEKGWEIVCLRFPDDEGFFSDISGSVSVVLAVEDLSLKEKIYGELSAIGTVDFPSIIHPRAYVSPDLSLGKGAVIAPFCTVSHSSKIGDFVDMKASSSVGHDCTVGDFVKMMPGARPAGAVKIGSRVCVGARSSIYYGVAIGNDVTVTPGSVVLRNVPDNARAHGNPARVAGNFGERGE